jgi:hypothetical protein
LHSVNGVVRHLSCRVFETELVIVCKDFSIYLFHIFMTLSWNVTDLPHFKIVVMGGRRLNNNSLSGSIPKSLTAITALQVL